MPRDPVDPARLQGEALARWYRRTPEEIEAARHADETERHRDYFAVTSADGPAEEPRRTSQVSRPGGDDGVLWIATGRGGYRAVRPSQTEGRAILESGSPEPVPEWLPDNSALSEEGEFIEVGNPHNRRLKKEFVRTYGYWPKTEDGRDFHVAHIKATADGGSQTLDNIRPMDPDEHIAEHKANGDFARWGTRSGKGAGRAGAPRVRGVPRIPGLGVLTLIPTVTGILSGRIRTDTPEHFWYDMAGLPSPDDVEAERRRIQQQTFPECPPGNICV